jgi:hypothetical protein
MDDGSSCDSFIVQGDRINPATTRNANSVTSEGEERMGSGGDTWQQWPVQALVPHLSLNSLLKVAFIFHIHSAKAVWTPTGLHDSFNSQALLDGQKVIIFGNALVGSRVRNVKRSKENRRCLKQERLAVIWNLLV